MQKSCVNFTEITMKIKKKIKEQHIERLQIIVTEQIDIRRSGSKHMNM